MAHSNQLRVAIRRALAASSIAAITATVPVHAQDSAGDIDTVVVTGTRISVPGVTSSSPVYSVGAQDIKMQQQPELEKILRQLPITQAQDGANVNNGTAGVATISLRGLGPQRNLILMDGKRVIPYNTDGIVDTSTIPTALVERIDIVTGGASAVYGSDAISGALNFIMRKDFEGIDIDTNFSQTEKSDGKIAGIALTMGSNVADGRGNVVLSLNYSNRDPVLLGARALGQVGIGTADGAGYEEFLAGEGPIPAPAGCGGPGAVATGGSGTTLPTRVSIAGGGAIGQFRDDGTLGANCSVFNFNPFNYYQTPLQRFGGTALANFEMNEHAEAYARFNYASTVVAQQVAPGGLFATTALWTPLANSFITPQARQVFIDRFNAGRATGVVTETGDFPNWRDLNGNGVVDVEDDVRIGYARRTPELGPRRSEYNNNVFQMLTGFRGDIAAGWDYDVFFSYGKSDRATISSGYADPVKAQNAIDAVPNEDGVLTCRNGDPACVPLNLFGGYGAITPEMGGYTGASGTLTEAYTQRIAGASVSGPINALQVPFADSPLAASVGVEYRQEKGSATPDECWKAGCLNGAGGNILPISGGFTVKEAFAEAILPLVSDKPMFSSFDIELGYRYSDYNMTGSSDAYKYGFNWKPVDSLMFRAMKQRATRAPNVGELASPLTASLDNAVGDPCSEGNAVNITPELTALCISTGMTAGQVGVVQDIVVGQINSFSGTDLSDLPGPEEADTLTVGVVWTPSFGGALTNAVFSLDYYDIDIKNYIGEFSPQEVLDSCYKLGDADACSKIRRLGGGLTLDGSGVETFTTNLDYMRAEGVELGFTLGFDIGAAGQLTFAGNVNKYLTQEYRSAQLSPVTDCLGYYGTSCGGPLPEFRWLQRTTWDYRNFQVSLIWRHMGKVERERPDLQAIIDGGDVPFQPFTRIAAHDYFDLYGSWQALDNLRVYAGVTNLLDKDPPVVGNEAADTSSNSGNTFPSAYDPLGRVFSMGVNFTF